MQDSAIGKYCSRLCKSAAAERVEIRCLHCGLIFVALKSQARQKKYCSRECKEEYKRVRRVHHCMNCGQQFLAYPSASRKFCSKRCQNELLPSTRYVDGRASHPQYTRWYNMMARCTKPDHQMYPSYGGRGITVCEEWHVPANFYRYLEEVLGPCPPDHSIDRVDNNGNYEPGNIRWASASQQNTNRNPYTWPSAVKPC